MGVERLAAIESARLLIREPSKYKSLVVNLYLSALKDYRTSKLARASYFFMRHIDDSLDERKEESDDRLSYVLSMRDQVESGNFTGKPKVVGLANYALKKIEAKALLEDNPRQDFLTSIDTMIFDYKRSKERRVLSSQELNDYYHDTFFPVVNLSLIILGSKFRAVDLPELSFSQGRVYSIRDLKIDWQRGVINIPKEILDQAKLTQDSPIGEVNKNPIILSWIRRELLISRQELDSLNRRLRESGEKFTPLLPRGVTKVTQKLIKQYGFT